MKWMGRAFLTLLISIVMVALTGWGTLAIYYSNVPGEGLRKIIALAFAFFGAALLVWYLVSSKRVLPLLVFFAAFLLLVAWWSTTPALQDRDWAPEYARLPHATINGDLVTIHNIRNFEYRTETDFTPRYYDKTFDLRQLDSVDVIASYWMGDAIAHTIISFGFSGKDFLAISIETRRERHESYSSIAGFFKQYELFYVVADERDLIRLRTNYRKDPPEDVYLYRTVAPPANARRIFLDYIREINALADKPEFYNSLTTNCTTSILTHTRVNPDHLPLSWKVLLSGYVPAYLYEHRRIDTSLPFEELKRRSHINAVAQAADNEQDFSQRIRAGLPTPPKLPSS
ncbi:MAG TPA: DUF4105 domain-containing protein [Candidatus Binatia bacterium]|nr:DUF4105 domain-containing protein [Candidatus Binatia bacterium]